jgi:hypothetical protein
MKRGDLVVAHYDEQRGIECIGLVLEVKKSRSKKVQQDNSRDRYKSNVVVATLADWMVARTTAKGR